MVRSLKTLIFIYFILFFNDILAASPSIFDIAEDTKVSATSRCKAIFVVLNKQTTERKILILSIGEDKIAYNLSIALIKCHIDKENKTKGSFIEIYENSFDDDRSFIGRQWVLYPEHQLSSLKNPIYEVILLDVI